MEMVERADPISSSEVLLGVSKEYPSSSGILA